MRPLPFSSLAKLTFQQWLSLTGSPLPDIDISSGLRTKYTPRQRWRNAINAVRVAHRLTGSISSVSSGLPSRTASLAVPLSTVQSTESGGWDVPDSHTQPLQLLRKVASNTDHTTTHLTSPPAPRRVMSVDDQDEHTSHPAADHQDEDSESDGESGRPMPGSFDWGTASRNRRTRASTETKRGTSTEHTTAPPTSASAPSSPPEGIAARLARMRIALVGS